MLTARQLTVYDSMAGVHDRLVLISSEILTEALLPSASGAGLGFQPLYRSGLPTQYGQLLTSMMNAGGYEQNSCSTEEQVSTGVYG